MFDPHHLKRKSRASKTGQIIQCKPTNVPMTFDLKTWQLYYQWAQKNNLIPNPPEPTSNFILSNFDTSKTILENIALQEEHEYKRLIIFNEENVNYIQDLAGYGDSICSYVNDEPFDRSEFLFDNQYIFSYHGGSTSALTNVVFDINLNDFYIDVINRPNNQYHTWYSNIDNGGDPFVISDVSPAEPIPTNFYVSWHIDYYNTQDPLSIMNQYCQNPLIDLGNPTLVDGVMTDYGSNINIYLINQTLTCLYFY